MEDVETDKFRIPSERDFQIDVHKLELERRNEEAEECFCLVLSSLEHHKTTSSVPADYQKSEVASCTSALSAAGHLLQLFHSGTPTLI
ncbi:unnamed protein product [Caretta caretta]